MHDSFVGLAVKTTEISIQNSLGTPKAALTVCCDGGASENLLDVWAVALQRSHGLGDVLQREHGVGSVDGFGKPLV